MYGFHFINKVLKQRKSLSIQKLAEKYSISTRTIQNWIQGKLPKGKRNKPNLLFLQLLLRVIHQIIEEENNKTTGKKLSKNGITL